jgi:hypothetical protein
MMKKWIVFMMSTALGACMVGSNDESEGSDQPSAAAATENDAVTPDDIAFYDMSEVEPGQPELIAPDDSLPTIESTTRGQRAILWYRAHLGSMAYEHFCELAAELSFGTRGRFPSAIANWNWQVAHGYAHRGVRHAPLGALVFWRTSVFGHVAVADGYGGEWSTSVNNRIGHASSTYYFNNYLGWAYAPASWPGR